MTSLIRCLLLTSNRSVRSGQMATQDMPKGDMTPTTIPPPRSIFRGHWRGQHVSEEGALSGKGQCVLGKQRGKLV